MVLVAPFNWYTLNNGLVFGLEPPTAGEAWQLAQLLESKPGPRPKVLGTLLISLKIPLNPEKSVVWFAVMPAIVPPAPTAPARTPGSTASDCATTAVAPQEQTRARAAIFVAL